MQKWEVAQQYLFTKAATDTPFNAVGAGVDLGISTRQASDLIQAFLRAQRRKNSPTTLVLSRVGRTKAAVWHVGAREVDVRGLGRQEAADMLHRVMRAIAPDLRRMGGVNPYVMNLAQAMTSAFIANLNVLLTANSVQQSSSTP